MENKDSIKIGGYTAKNFIKFKSEKYSVLINDKNNFYKIIKNKNIEQNKVIKKIPLIRGVYILLKILYERLFNIKSFIFLLIILLVSQLLKMDSLNSYSVTIEKSIVYFLFIFMIIYLFTVRNRHGLEHRLIACFEKYNCIDVDKVYKCSPYNKRCGTVLVFYYLLFLIIFSSYNSILSTIISFSLAFEIFLLINNDNFFSKVFIFPGLLLQRITVGKKNKNYNLKLFKDGLSELIKLEKENKI
jgi:uncharacterized protein YqhQ